MGICWGPRCGQRLPKPGTQGGRPRKFCSTRCRARWRRQHARMKRVGDRREGRLTAVGEELHVLRSAAYAAANAARRLAAELDVEPDRLEREQPAAWYGLKPPADWADAGRYTRAALEVLGETADLMAAAVAVDRAAGSTWAEIGATLGVSADTASRRYRVAAPVTADPSPSQGSCPEGG